MYKMYFGSVRMPVVPKSVETKISGNNATVTLINEGEINQLKSPKLTEISFDLLIPQINKYPFATYGETGFQKSAQYYLNLFEDYLVNKKPFKFKLLRIAPDGKFLFKKADGSNDNAGLTVTIENYTIKESASNGFDVVVSITLKKYVKYGTVKIKIKKKKNTKILTKKQIKRVNKKLPKKNYVVKKGETLYTIAKKWYGSGNAKYKKLIYNTNKKTIEKKAKKAGYKSSLNGKRLIKGTKITIPKLKG